uniref:Terpene synthase family protein n=1 Tax=Chrysopogon zizanioides TaxID=167337 RepID=A0A7S4Y961_9POAL|nr:terpene synthase family protein [Chrysopogon zizanioides]
MAASITVAAAHGPPAAIPETKRSTVDDVPFQSSVWGDYFVNYTPPASQRSEEWMRERVDELRGEVRRKFKTTMSMAETMVLVDTLERLAIDGHFRKDIDLALSQIHMEGKPAGISSSNKLYIVALGFRLLRQHGFWVSADVFDKFRDSTGKLSKGLSGDVKGLLSLYNAAHMAVPGEKSLDEAIDFTRRCLESAKDRLVAPMSVQVSRALSIPLPRYLPRLEAMHYISEYGQEEDHDAKILELARLDYALVQSLYLKELRELTLWWKELYHSVNLPNTRDRIVEMYFFAFGMLQTEEYSRARLIDSKIIALVSLMDDIYDEHASFEEAQKFNEAIQRWNESAVSDLPEYMRMLYTQILSTFAKFEEVLGPNEKYRVSYAKEAYKLQSMYYFLENKWCHENHMPSFGEHIHLSSMSAGLQVLIVGAWIGAHHAIAKESLEWAITYPEVFRAAGDVGRLLNDIASFKKRKNSKDAPNALECYVREHGVTGEEAAAACAAIVELGWRKINRARMEIHPMLVPAAQMDAKINLTRVCEILYYRGMDGYTFGSDLRDVITSLFIKPAAGGPA